MPLLRSSLIGGHTCRKVTKRSDSSNKPCRALTQDHLTVCLFVCLFHGVPEVRGGRRLTKDGPYATRRQAEAFLFVRRKPTPPFAGCQGNLLFRGSRGLQTGRPVDHRPYSARHVGLKVESFGNNKPCAPRPPQRSAYQGAQVLLGDTPWR